MESLLHKVLLNFFNFETNMVLRSLSERVCVYTTHTYNVYNKILKQNMKCSISFKYKDYKYKYICIIETCSD